MANPSEIIDEIEALALHCRPPLMAVEQRQRWAVDWANDLSKFPIDAIRNAFRNWRHGESGKFPTPGQILPMIRAQLPRDDTPQIKAWSYDLPEGEYQAMSLSDKIRHHRISASHCRGKAGPMHTGSRHLSEAEMSDVWRSWRARAVNHDTEANRLTATLRQYEDRA